MASTWRGSLIATASSILSAGRSENCFISHRGATSGRSAKMVERTTTAAASGIETRPENTSRASVCSVLIGSSVHGAQKLSRRSRLLHLFLTKFWQPRHRIRVLRPQHRIRVAHFPSFSAGLLNFESQRAAAFRKKPEFQSPGFGLFGCKKTKRAGNIRVTTLQQSLGERENLKYAPLEIGSAEFTWF